MIQKRGSTSWNNNSITHEIFHCSSWHVLSSSWRTEEKQSTKSVKENCEGMQDLAREFDEEKGTRWEILKKERGTCVQGSN